ncbi:hypothetical protein FKM82_027213, partial [Ascaphus truei]
GDGISSIPWINYLLSYLPSLVYLFSLFWPFTQNNNKFTVGIITEKEDCGWMEKLLQSADFKDHVDDVQSICSSRDGDQETKDKVSLCSFLVLYHTGGVRDDLSDLGDRLREMENLCLKNGKNDIL